VTNTDGDSILEVRDTSGTWHTHNYPNGQYWVVVYASDQYGNTTPDSQLVTVTGSGVEEKGSEGGGAFAFQAGPNPFRGELDVRYALPQPEHVTLLVYNVMGQVVRVLAEGEEHGGLHRVRWDRRTVEGEEAGAGIYFLRLQAGPYRSTRRVLLLR
jgi:flagellar hook assembly protein FlgD